MQTLRENPTTKNEFLRYQIGRMETRREQELVYQGSAIIGHRTGTAFVPVFHLLGYGSSLRAAENAAARATA